MLNDISGAAASPSNFNFHLTSSLSQNKLKSLLNPTPNANAKGSPDLTSLAESEKCSDSKELLASVAANGADNLSWKFFEHVDSLDHQLRSDESSPPHLLNGGVLPVPTALPVKAIDETNVATSTTMSATLGIQSASSYNHSTIPAQNLTAASNRKSNGYAINGTLLQNSTEILPQTNATSATTTAPSAPDLNNTPVLGEIRPLLQQQSAEATFAFTSPTSTFKRKKQQQLRKQETKDKELQQQQQQDLLYQEFHNNNNFHKKGINCGGFLTAAERPLDRNEEAINPELDDYSNTGSSKGSNSTLLRQPGAIQQQQQQEQQPYHQQQQQPKRYNNTNDAKTVINTSTGVIITDTVVTYASTSALSSIIVGGGNGTTLTGYSNGTASALHSIRTNTLPLITKACAGAATTATVASASKLPSTYLAGGIVDLVHDSKCASASSSAAITAKSLLKSKTKSRGCSNSTTNNATTAGKAYNSNSNSNSHKQATRQAKMQASSSGGSGTTTTAKGFSNSSLVDDIEMHLGLIGWRKKCLYTLLVLLMLLIIINLGLTLWILKVMEFTTEGMGQLKIVPGGIQLTGQALIMDMLRASSIRSRHGQPISIESSRNFSINTRGTDGLLENHLFLGHDKLECMATEFRINDTNGRNLFSVNRNEVTIGAHALRIEGEGGAIFRESIQTPHVRAEPGRELRLESPTRQLEMTAAKDINLQSRAGGIEVTALEDVKLTALDGSLRFESSKIFMPNLRTVQMPLPGTPPSREHLHRVFQLCACSNGKLFLASPHSICAGDDNTVCR